MKNIILLSFLLFCQLSIAQVSINNTGAAPATAAMLDINATNKGLLIPRNANPMVNIPNPTNGLLVYNTTTNLFNFYNGNSWQKIVSKNIVDIIEYRIYPISNNIVKITYTDNLGNPIEITDWTLFVNGARSINITSTPFTANMEVVTNNSTFSSISYTLFISVNGVIAASVPVNVAAVSNNTSSINFVVQ